MNVRPLIVLVVVLGFSVRAEESAPPLVRAEGPAATAAPITDERISRVVAFSQPEVERCYLGRGQKSKKTREATLKMTFTLTLEGRVKDAAVDVAGSTLQDPGLHACAARVLSGLIFPQRAEQVADERVEWTFALGGNHVVDGVERADYGGKVPAGFHVEGHLARALDVRRLTRGQADEAQQHGETSHAPLLPARAHEGKLAFENQSPTKASWYGRAHGRRRRSEAHPRVDEG